MDLYTTDGASYGNGKYQIGLTSSTTNVLTSDETNNSETLFRNLKTFEEADENNSTNLTTDTTSATWRKEVTTSIQSHHQGSRQPWNKTEYLMVNTKH